LGPTGMKGESETGERKSAKRLLDTGPTKNSIHGGGKHMGGNWAQSWGFLWGGKKKRDKADWSRVAQKLFGGRVGGTSTTKEAPPLSLNKGKKRPAT